MELADDMKLMLIIYKYNQRQEPIWFSKLVEVSGMERSIVSKNEDKLYDVGLIDMSWDKVDGKWTRCFHIEEDAEHLMEALSQHIIKGE